MYVGPVSGPGAGEGVHVDLHQSQLSIVTMDQSELSFVTMDQSEISIVTVDQLEHSTVTDLVALLQLHEHALPHHVVPLVLPVLVHDARYVQPVLTQG